MGTSNKNIWVCKIGEDVGVLPHWADAPMRVAVEKAYFEITGKESDFLFSGWGGELTEGERQVVQKTEDRQHDPPLDKIQHTTTGEGL